MARQHSSSWLELLRPTKNAIKIPMTNEPTRP
jgi:hypothetical protein